MTCRVKVGTIDGHGSKPEYRVFIDIDGGGMNMASTYARKLAGRLTAAAYEADELNKPGELNKPDEGEAK